MYKNNNNNNNDNNNIKSINDFIPLLKSKQEKEKEKKL